MTHKPIQFEELGLFFPHKTCFREFSGQIHFGERIAIIGRNGSGKSTLLKRLNGLVPLCEGEIRLPEQLRVGYLPQIVTDFTELSGGQRLNHLLTKILTSEPNCLLLDEPTNHLDKQNRRSLIRMLKKFQGTLVIVSHDVELIESVADKIWHIDAQQITVFTGTLHDYQRELTYKKAALDQELTQLSQHKKEAHLRLMEEQTRNKTNRIRGEKHIEQRKWPTVRSNSKMANAVEAGNKRLSQIKERKVQLLKQLGSIYQPEEIVPAFCIKANNKQNTLITVHDASLFYIDGFVILENLNFQMKAKERVALCGPNGSGKSTLLKAIMGDYSVNKTGDWITPKPDNIGYLDQHYNNLHLEQTVLEMMSEAMPNIPVAEVRKHLNNFLFRKNEEVHAGIASLSGGEKARLSLALIAANPPDLLILDELTNNLDLEARAHLIQVLLQYPGAMIVISHDDDFLRKMNIETVYQFRQGHLVMDRTYEKHQGRG